MPNIDEMMYQGIRTQNGRFLVKTADGKVCYTDAEGNILRTVQEPEKEWKWALTTWKKSEVITLQADFVANLEKQLAYIVNS